MPGPQIIADCCLDSREVELIRTRFDRLDADKDGFLTYEELLGSLKRLKVPISEDEVKTMFDAVSPVSLYRTLLCLCTTACTELLYRDATELGGFCFYSPTVLRCAGEPDCCVFQRSPVL